MRYKKRWQEVRYDPRWREFTRHLRGAWVFSDLAGVTNGQATRDLSPHGNYGIMENSGGIQIRTRDRGQLIQFNPDNTPTDDDRVSFGTIAGNNPLALAGLTRFTILFCVRWLIQRNSFPRVIDKSTGGSAANGYSLYFRQDNPPQWRINVQVNSSGGQLSADMTLPEPVDYDFAFSYDHDRNPRGRFFKDRQLLSTDNTALQAPPNVSAPMGIGNWNHSTARMLRGEIEYMYVVGEALPDELIFALQEDPYAWIAEDEAPVWVFSPPGEPQPPTFVPAWARRGRRVAA